MYWCDGGDGGLCTHVIKKCQRTVYKRSQVRLPAKIKLGKNFAGVLYNISSINGQRIEAQALVMTPRIKA